MTATLTTPAGEDLEEGVRQLLDEARRNGEPEPGRPTLAKRLGVSQHQVRQVLAKVRQEDDETPTAQLSLVPSDDSTEPVVEAAGAELAVPGEPLAGSGDQAGEPEDQAGASGENQQVTRVARPGITLAKVYTITGFIFGSVTSVAFNVLAARIPPDNAPKGWQPDVIAELGSAVWPLALLLSVEVISRVRMPEGFWWVVAKGAGIAGVALGSAVISYQHIQAVLISWHYNPVSAGVGPLVLDGLMVLSGFAMLAMAGERRDARAAKQSPTPS